MLKITGTKCRESTLMAALWMKAGLLLLHWLEELRVLVVYTCTEAEWRIQ